MEQHALVLSGGGANGAFEVGVLKALAAGRCSHVSSIDQTDVYSGTSVGAVNASGLVSVAECGVREAVDWLERLWLDKIAGTPNRCGNGAYRIRGDLLSDVSPGCLTSNPFKWLTDSVADGTFFATDAVARMANLAKSSGSLVQRLLSIPNASDLFDTKPLHELLRQNIDFSAIHSSPKAFRAVATNWRNGRSQVFTNKDMVPGLGEQAILASAAIPGVFPEIKIGDETFVDGGASMNTPLVPALQACDCDRADHVILHVIYVDPAVEEIPFPDLPNTMSTVYRLVVIGFSVSLAGEIENVRQLVQGPSGRTANQALQGLAEQILQTRITIHRYRPGPNMMGGLLGMLDFSANRIEQLIAFGEQVATSHDCDANGCLLGVGGHANTWNGD